MEKIDITEIARAAGGKYDAGDKITVSGVSIDSRTVKKGDIFFAVKGAQFDGHKFIKAAVSKGAAAVVSQDKKSRFRIPVVLVKDTVAALQNFAKYYRNRFDVKVIGVTGSNGKTTTKDILASVLSRRASVLSNAGNLNNHIGLPLTLFNLEKKHRYCVLEMGANHSGEIARLCGISTPSAGIITNIGTAHIGNFGSLNNTLKAKMELFNSLDGNGLAVINNDDELIPGAAEKINCEKITFGIKNKADVTASDILLEARRTSFCLKYKKKKTRMALNAGGFFNVYNAAAAAACSVALGFSTDEITAGLKNFIPPAGRMETVKLKNGVVAVDDSYNANPTSMRAAIENFSKLYYNNRKILVLGDMLELGKFAAVEHEKIGEFIKTNNLADEVLTVGISAKYIAEKCGGKWFGNKTKLFEYLKKNLKKGDAVLFKASRKIALEDAVESLKTRCR